MNIRPFQIADQESVVALWTECGLTRPWNNPHLDIARKLTVQPELFIVAIVNDAVVGTAMIGFDGHRGWVYYLAVKPTQQRKTIGSALMAEAEQLLSQLGCPKICLMVRSSNTSVVEFYKELGYAQDDVVTLGKRLIHDI